MDIGGAMLVARLGKKVARGGWNGKGMFVYFVPAAAYPATTDVGKEIASADGTVPYREYLALRTRRRLGNHRSHPRPLKTTR